MPKTFKNHYVMRLVIEPITYKETDYEAGDLVIFKFNNQKAINDFYNNKRDIAKKTANLNPLYNVSFEGRTDNFDEFLNTKNYLNKTYKELYKFLYPKALNLLENYYSNVPRNFPDDRTGTNFVFVNMQARNLVSPGSSPVFTALGATFCKVFSGGETLDGFLNDPKFRTFRIIPDPFIASKTPPNALPYCQQWVNNVERDFFGKIVFILFYNLADKRGWSKEPIDIPY